jgi:general secretion pathway protein M
MISAFKMHLTPERLTCVAMLSATVLLPLLATAFGLHLWLKELAFRDEQIDADRDKLSRYQDLVATLPILRTALQSEQSNDTFRAFYFDAPTPAIAGAQLQREIQEMIRAAGARPISAQVLPFSDNEDPPRVRARIQLQGDTEQLQAVLHRIESSRPFLIIDQMSIRSQARSVPLVARQRPDVRRRNLAQTQGPLTVRIDVFGYFIRPSP